MTAIISKAGAGARALLLCAGILAAPLFWPAGEALAQTDSAQAAAPAAQGGSDQAVSVGEIVVQAEKRSQPLREVPEAVTVVTGAALAAVGPVNDTSDLINSVPGARFTNLGDPLQSEISIRGSGTERATGADTSVGLYVNGVYVGASGGGGRVFAPIDSLDTDHLEVLEGPQGALYGRDAEYGIVNIITQEPKFSDSGYVDELFNANTLQNQQTVIVNHAIDDNWAMRLSARGVEQNGGFEYNPDTNGYYDTTKGYEVRGQLRYRKDDLDVDLLAERQQMQLPSFWSADQVAPKNTVTGYPGLPTYPLGFHQDPRSIPHNGTDFTEEDVNNVTLLVDYDLHWAQLHSTSSWRSVTTLDDIDSDYIDLPTEIAAQQLGEKGSYPFSQTSDVGNTTTWYEDLHLVGAPVLDKRLTWLGGVEVMAQPNNGYETLSGNPCKTSAAPNPVVGQGACTGTPTNPVCVSILPGSKCPAVVSPYGDYAPYSGNYVSWAPYGSATAALPFGFKVQGDVRYSHDRKTEHENVVTLYTGQQYPFLTGGTIEPSNYLLDKGQWTYAVTLSYKLPGPWDDMLYAKVGTGYRVGGFNLGHTAPLLTGALPPSINKNVFYAPVTPAYNDETSTSYEVGFKGDITSHLYFTVDAYTQTTLNALAAVGDGCLATNQCETGNTNYTVNSGKVQGSGIEAQLNTAWDLFGGRMNLQLDGSTQTAKVVSEPTTGANGEPLVGLPLVGTPISENPRWLGNLTFNYSRPIVGDVKGFFNLLYHGQWGGIMDPITVAGVYSPLADFEEVNLRTGFDYKNFEMAFLVNNLTNDVYPLHIFGQAGVNTVTGIPQLVQSQERLSLPRSLSLEASYRW